MTAREELERQLIDAEGESSACSDGDCGCHKRPQEIRDELEWLEEQEESERRRVAIDHLLRWKAAAVAVMTDEQLAAVEERVGA